MDFDIILAINLPGLMATHAEEVGIGVFAKDNPGSLRVFDGFVEELKAVSVA